MRCYLHLLDRLIRPADKEYRKGIHWLETLRIRRIKILEGAFTVCDNDDDL